MKRSKGIMILAVLILVFVAGVVFSQFITKKEIYFGKQATLNTGDRLVVVLNPSSVSGGTSVFDKTVSATYDGIVVNLVISGAVPQ